ncbi:MULTISPECIES: O-antigen ligase family protein [unclassified Francisella]|uniref:O-antigen ligase family protein n=1 Tax=unclassified Francisella TaxID=2610885 RepID=UPI002E3764B0|nr:MULTISPECIES: O-antigen ligase family protein [unclassified Francisella]MED7819240.1 O-antigen ligase family protein [Francisella sp. 19S2-4]MED7830029.1 O-antigen ligase family protein [Francisella sp. 19S2-10]
MKVSSDVLIKLNFIFIIFMFVGVAGHLQAFISIGWVGVIATYLLNKDFSLIDFKKNKFFWPLLGMGILICFNLIYLMVVNKTGLYFKDLIYFANPMILLIFLYGSSHMLSKNIRYANYLLYTLAFIVVSIATFRFLLFFVYLLDGQNYVIQNMDEIAGQQFIFAILLPFCAFFLAVKALDVSKNKIVFRVIAFIIVSILIFTTLFINTSKMGYIIGAVAFIYYFILLIKKVVKYNQLNIKKVLLILLISFGVLLTAFTTVYKDSNVLRDRITPMVTNLNDFFSNNYSTSQRNELENTSTGIRLLFYTTSVIVLKSDLKVFLLGCPIAEHTIDFGKCVEQVVQKSPNIQKSNRVFSNLSDMPYDHPHDDFLYYTFKAGILAGALEILFFIFLFYGSKKLDQYDSSCMRVLLLGFLVLCLFDRGMSYQSFTATIFSILSIYIAKILHNQRK